MRFSEKKRKSIPFSYNHSFKRINLNLTIGNEIIITYTNKYYLYNIYVSWNEKKIGFASIV